jgi:ATP-dependent RNA helicase MSS116
VVDTVGEVVASQTHVHVKQEVATVTMDDVIPAVVSMLQREINKGGNYKIIVFFSTARVTGYMAGLFEKLQCPVLEIHSRKSQSARIKTSGNALFSQFLAMLFVNLWLCKYILYCRTIP